MRSGRLYQLPTDNKNTQNGFRGVKYIFFGALLLLCSYVKAAPAPATIHFVKGNSQHDTLCANESYDISNLLTVIDNVGDTVTWTIQYGSPYHGIVNGLSYVDTLVATDSGKVGGVVYIPTVGYSGNDGIIVTAKDNYGNSVTTNIHLKINPQPSIVLGPNPSVCAGATTATISYSGLSNVEADTVLFNTVGSVQWTVPANVYKLNFDVQGARGGADDATPNPVPGNGGRIQGTLLVNGGEVLNLNIGGIGGSASGSSGALGGVNGGGSASYFVYGTGGGGGGSSDIRVGGNGLANRVVVAGGGGGSGYDGSASKAGGDGGGFVGDSSAPNDGGTYAHGGSQMAGGAGASGYSIWTVPGQSGSLWQGGEGSSQGISGGGGGGYYGGGGGLWTGGAGGSSYADTVGSLTAGIITTSGYDTSNGQITFNYVITGTYSIVWSDAAHLAGFRDTSSVPMPITDAGSFNISIPNIVDTTLAVTYSGTLTVSSPTCTSPGYVFGVIVNPIAEVFPNPGSPVACNGDSIQSILFTGTPGATFSWVASGPAIGLASTSGSGKIFGFATNNGGATAPAIVTVTVTPTENTCTGTPKIFTITDNPIPVLNSTTHPAATCDSMPFIYPASSATAGVNYSWSRAVVTGISNLAEMGNTNTVDDTLNNTTDTAITVAYQFILNYSGCLDTQYVNVNIDPHPVLTSTLTPAAICSGTTFSYTPTSSDTGTIITWSRAAIAGISNPAGNGIGNPNEILYNTRTNADTVTYIDTLTLSYNNTCSYTQSVTVVVNPTPQLNSPLIGASTCDTVSYTATSATTGTTFAWSRAEIFDISNPASSDTGATIYEGLTNTQSHFVVVAYTYTLTANGCTNTQVVTDTVKPTPTLINPVPYPDSICNNVLFAYTAISGTSGVSYAWKRSATFSISNAADSANSASISETLNNTSSATVPVTYVYTLSAAGCVNMVDVIITVNPTPMLSNIPVDTSVCDNTLFTYSPASATSGATYTWTMPYVPGISSFDTSGTGAATVTLDNTTYVNVDDTFKYTITANGCSNMQNVVFTVHPNPTLSSDSTEVMCSGTPFIYYPQSYTPATAFSWILLTTASGISSSNNSGSGFTLTDSLTSTYATDTIVVFQYTLLANGCSNTQNVSVQVNPAPTIANLTTMAPNTACDNTMYQNFGTSVAPDSGFLYSWSADNAQVYAIGSNGQYALINFNNPGVATIYLYVGNEATGCLSNQGYTVTVSSTDNSSPAVIYANGEFICQDNTADHYQWGYDNGTSLDSTIVAGETNQNYFNPSPITNAYYWVMTTHGDCTQKSYYIIPNSNTTGVTNVNGAQDGINVYPNPTADDVNVDIHAVAGGNFRIEVLNLMGQSVNSISTRDHNVKINVASLPAGCYLVDCYNDGVKIATAKFIKN